MIKYYSDKTKKYYDSVEDANAAEFELKQEENRQKILRERAAAEAKEKSERLAKERKERANEVEAARKAMMDARSTYTKLLNDFIRDYKSYHLSITNEDDERDNSSLLDLFPLFFNF